MCNSSSLDSLEEMKVGLLEIQEVKECLNNERVGVSLYWEFENFMRNRKA